MDRQQDMRKPTEIVNMQRQQQMLEKKQQALLNQYVWPTAIPTQLKDYCLQDFSNHMSMSVLRQSTCIICNIRAYANTMKECALQDIPNSDKLFYHADLTNIISKTQQTTESEDIKCLITREYISLFFTDHGAHLSFFTSSNAIFYKKGYDTTTKTGNICQQCYGALVKDKIPIFSAANKMWIGDVPLVLQQLTIAEEKL
jgi:hypothetical protein